MVSIVDKYIENRIWIACQKNITFISFFDSKTQIQNSQRFVSIPAQNIDHFVNSSSEKKDGCFWYTLLYVLN